MSPAEILDRLVADEMRAALGSTVIGREIIVLDQTGSTNDAILQFATPDSKEGLVLFAEHQPAENFGRIHHLPAAQLTAWAAETISGAIENEFSLKTTIKLPNDVQIDGRKVAGVLVEMRAHEKAPYSAIVGIGINVNQALEDFPKELQSRAISLAIALGRQVDRRNFAIALLRNLDRSYRERFG